MNLVLLSVPFLSTGANVTPSVLWHSVILPLSVRCLTTLRVPLQCRPKVWLTVSPPRRQDGRLNIVGKAVNRPLTKLPTLPTNVLVAFDGSLSVCGLCGLLKPPMQI